MDFTRDNPLKRFAALWIGLGIFLLFGALTLVIAPLAKERQDKAYAIKEAQRLDTKRGIEVAQRTELEARDLTKGREALAKMVATRPTASEMKVPAAPAAQANPEVDKADPSTKGDSEQPNAQGATPQK